MATFVLRRLLLLVPTLFGVSLITFGLVKLAPGSVEDLRFADTGLAGGGAAGVDLEAAQRAFRRRFLLDQPLWRQYLHHVGPFDLSERGHAWFGGSGERPFGGLLAGDLGTEMLRPSVRVADELAARLSVTVPIAGLALLIAYALAIPLGVHAAVRRGTPLERASTLALFALYAVPTFWAALLLQLAFGRTGLDWLPVVGLADPDAERLGAAGRLADRAAHLVLPIACYAYGGLAYLSRQMRSGVLECLGADWVRTARAKGLPERVVIGKHVLRNALIPIVTLLGTVLPLLIGGSVVVEVVFDLPGVGRYAYEGLVRREVPVILATTLLSALMTMLGFLISDVLYAVVDPRIRHG